MLKFPLNTVFVAVIVRFKAIAPFSPQQNYSYCSPFYPILELPAFLLSCGIYLKYFRKEILILTVCNLDFRFIMFTSFFRFRNVDTPATDLKVTYAHRLQYSFISYCTRPCCWSVCGDRHSFVSRLCTTWLVINFKICDMNQISFCCLKFLELYLYTNEIHNYWVLELFPSTGIVENREQVVSETESVSVLRWRGEKTPTQLGPLESANLNHWTTPVRFTQLFNHLRPG
jgi:hypothetical protein